METAAAILLKAIVENNSGLKVRISNLTEPRQVEEVLKPYYQAAFALVRKVSSGEA